MKRILLFLSLIMVFVLFFSAMPASISADDDSEGGGSMDVYPGKAGCTTTIKLHAWNAEGIQILVWVFKFGGSFEELLEIGESTDGEGVIPLLVYGFIPNEEFPEDAEGFFTIDSDDWYKSIHLTLNSGHYIAVLAPIMEGDDGGINPETFIIKEFNVSGTCEEEVIPWVRNVEMTCSSVWINSDNAFEFVFFWEYADNNWVKIYDMAGNEVFSIDMPYGDAHFTADLPDGMYTVKTFNDQPEPIQEFVIGKP